jgi:hypothetical protein
MTVLEFFNLGKKEATMSTRERVEREIYNLREKAEECLLAQNIDEYNRILITIATLQETHGVLYGADRKQHERTA